MILLSVDKAHPTKKYFFLLGLSFLGLASLSWLRFYWVGTPKIETVPLSLPFQIGFRTAMFFFFGGASWAYCKIVTAPSEDLSLEKLWRPILLIYSISALSLPLTSNDIFSNLAYGEMMRVGLNPFRFGPEILDLQNPFRALVDRFWLPTPMIYGPVIGGMNRIAVMGGGIWNSLVLYKVLSLFLSFAVAGAAALVCKKKLLQDQQVKAFLFFAFNPLLIWELCAQAHNDGVVLLSLLGFIYLAEEEKFFPAFLCLLAGYFSKIIVLPVLGLYLCHIFRFSRRKAFLFAALFGISTLLLTSHFQERFGWVLQRPVAAAFDPSRLTNSIGYLIYWGLSAWGETVQTRIYRLFWWGNVIGMGALALWGIFQTRQFNGVLRGSLLFLLFFNLLASPAFQAWHILWLFPLVLILPKAREKNFILLYSIFALLQYPLANDYLWAAIQLILLCVLTGQSFAESRAGPESLAKGG